MPALVKKNAHLIGQVARLEEELKVVQWYMEVLERGVDTKDVTAAFTALSKEHKKLKRQSKREIEKLTIDNKKLTKKLAETRKALVKQQDFVVRPLIEECSKREAECQKLNQAVVERTKSLKILFAITKSPKMSDLVYKEERKRFTEEKLQEMSEKAVLTLR